MRSCGMICLSATDFEARTAIRAFLLIVSEEAGEFLLYPVPAFFANPNTPKWPVLSFSLVSLRLHTELHGVTASDSCVIV
jgi:hypothetical protein